MRKSFCAVPLFAVLFLAPSPSIAQTKNVPRSRYSPTAAAGPQRQAETWYDFLLERFNPTNIDYGARLEERRRTFLDASVKNPYFLFSFSMVLTVILLMGVTTKLWIDKRRERWITAEMMADLYNHDQYSRQVAREAIEKYNRHVERCNRVVEAAESGQPIPGSSTEVEELRADLKETAGSLEAMTRERDKLQADLSEKARVMADLSLRVQAVAGKPNGNAATGGVGDVNVRATGEESDRGRLMAHINLLQEQLYAEQQKNKRLRGA